MNIKYMPVGDQGILMEFGREISPDISHKIRGVMNVLEEGGLIDALGIKELIPTYRSILILFDPLVTDMKTLKEGLNSILSKVDGQKKEIRRTILIPTLYGGDMGPDIDFVAKNAGISKEEVIKRHSSVDYLVYMLGFTPGFTYLGGLDPIIATPRLSSARIRIPAGSVGIADQQTGIYPIDSPGGWQLIGRTPLELYTPEADPPVLLRAGDYIRFLPIEEDEFLKIKESIKKGNYQVEVHEERGSLDHSKKGETWEN